MLDLRFTVDFMLVLEFDQILIREYGKLVTFPHDVIPFWTSGCGDYVFVLFLFIIELFYLLY